MDIYIKEVNCFIGLGVFAVRNIRRGEIIICGVGEVVHQQTKYTVQIGWDEHMDAPAPIKYLNHSCEPNLGVVQADRNGLAFAALRDIQAGEELTFDYAMTEYMHYPRVNPDEEFDLTCRCGSAHCRGRLGYYSELSEALKARYRDFVAPYLLTEAWVAMDLSLAAVWRNAHGD